MRRGTRPIDAFLAENVVTAMHCTVRAEVMPLADDAGVMQHAHGVQ